ncbi:hypothetical protein [Spirillospora sp. NBC_01491]|uniref:hypothetical protein n=1 Tax=Spirillospora sp. NBC_01491 TaxID=2976007 RepID=UPI002E2F0C58|nr:hypothetical protein [Spirillospora sp. NBC_01491]
MPSSRHDALNQLFRDRPEFAVELLNDVLGLALPTGTQVKLEANDFNDRPSNDFRPDTVITLGAPHAPAHGIIVEIQQDRTESKRRQLPRYAAALWLMLRCPVTVLVICPDARTAAGFTGPITTELPGYTFQAAVLSPDQIPVMTDPKEIATHPDLAVLSVMAYGKDPAVTRAFITSLGALNRDNAAQYYEHAYSMASFAVQKLMEEIVSTTWPVHSPFAREHYGRGEADMLLFILSKRDMRLSEAQRAQITSCTDVDQLHRWAERALHATTADDLFA